MQELKKLLKSLELREIELKKEYNQINDSLLKTGMTVPKYKRKLRDIKSRLNENILIQIAIQQRLD